VLIQGENGTGKELVARAIHRGSARREAPFVVTNCSAFNDNLLDSELFGHKRGAFTGANADKPGLFEVADLGTFFLDEIGDMSPTLQVKVLRVLQDGTFNRVGDTETRKVDVRIIAATNRDLRAMAREGTFREDLYHRLAVFPIRLPPLRERREDIVPLAERLLSRLAESAGRRTCPRLDDDVKARLESGDWPGNVRELRNVLERAMILADGPLLELPHLWIEGSTAPADPSSARSGESSLAELERQTIQRTLAAVGGNRRVAATKLGIGLRTLYEKLKRYDLR